MEKKPRIARVTLAFLQERKASNSLEGCFKKRGELVLTIKDFYEDVKKSRFHEHDAIWLIAQPEFVDYFLQLRGQIHDSWFGRAIDPAGRQGHYDTIKALLDAGIKLGGSDTYQALDGAAEGGNLKIIELLLANGADINENHGNALHLALMRKHWEVAEYLLRRKIRLTVIPRSMKALNIFMKYGVLSEALVLEAFENACMFSEDIDFIQRLITLDVDLNRKNNLAEAARRGCLCVVRLLIDSGCDVKRYGAQALAAADNGRIEAEEKGYQRSPECGCYDEVIILLCQETEKAFKEKR